MRTWIYNDGGRAEAGYRGDAGDCGCRAIAIVTGKSYAEVYKTLNEFCKAERKSKKRRKSSARTGVHRVTMNRFMESIGWVWVSTMGIGTGMRVHLKAEELPAGRIVTRLSRHYAAVIDGTVHDTHDSTRGGTRGVYGYWIQGEGETR